MFNHRNYEISIDQHGNFIAEVGEVQISKPTLVEAQKAIDREIAGMEKPKIALDVIGILMYRKARYDTSKRMGIGTAILTGFNRTDQSPQYSGLKDGEYLTNVMVNTPQNASLLSEFIAAGDRFSQVEHEVTEQMLQMRHRHYGRIELEEYPELLKDAQENYDKLKALGQPRTHQAPA